VFRGDSLLVWTYRMKYCLWCLLHIINQTGVNISRFVGFLFSFSFQCKLYLYITYESFFISVTADELWKGALAETGVGVKKGRGKRRKKKLRRNLNRGQEVGEGRFINKGLKTCLDDVLVSSGLTVTQRKKEEPERIQSDIVQQRDTWQKKRKIKVKREGGWSGKCWGGILCGFFLQVKNVFCMKAKEGRKRSIHALVAIGNGKGAAGIFSRRNLAVMLFLSFPPVYHDITVKFKRTTIHMKKQNKGYSLHCHRAIITICKLIDIRDMCAKVSGSKNLINITRALFKGLTQQETHQQLANQKSLYVVEFREEQGPLPIVVALPEGTVREDPEPEDVVPDTKLEWSEVKAAQGMTRSPWINVRRMAW
uniref:Small ribosomal subunit protein uS5m n=1 Tax=Athene cunicularia TaxID=194338 RepID=A0A663N305_ATHCN